MKSVKSIQKKIKAISNILEEALWQRRNLHQLKNNELYSKEYEQWGKVIDEANAKLWELNGELEIAVLCEK